MAKKDRQFWESAAMNNASFRHYFNRLVELSISMFEWKNLPETVDPRFLELTLFTDGQAVFFYDEVMGYLALQNIMGGAFDVYRIPITRRAYAVNGYQRELTNENSVIIYNNYLHTNCAVDVELYAKRLYNLDRAIDVNANAQKTPILIQCAENERLTMLNLYKQFDGNEPFIFGCKEMNPNGIKSMSTQAPYVADKLYQLKVQIWNEVLTYLGISNINTSKKERLISDEVTKNMGAVIASRYSRLEARREACKKINEMFGLDIWCDYREDYQLISDEDTVEGEPNSDGKGGDTDDE